MIVCALRLAPVQCPELGCDYAVCRDATRNDISGAERAEVSLDPRRCRQARLDLLFLW